MESTRRFIKSFDIFGKHISLRFDKRWDTHKTKIGGLSTILIVFCILMYVNYLILQKFSNFHNIFAFRYSSDCINILVNYG
jgi:hypothetical protein